MNAPSKIRPINLNVTPKLYCSLSNYKGRRRYYTYPRVHGQHINYNTLELILLIHHCTIPRPLSTVQGNILLLTFNSAIQNEDAYGAYSRNNLHTIRL